MAKKTKKKVAKEEGQLDTDKIKQMLAEQADKQREAGIKKVQAKQPKEQKRISFDVWYAMKGKLIPVHHRKEVIKADMIARGVNGLRTEEEFNKALEAYGVKL